jgi:hypothetical protein
MGPPKRPDISGYALAFLVNSSAEFGAAGKRSDQVNADYVAVSSAARPTP